MASICLERVIKPFLSLWDMLSPYPQKEKTWNSGEPAMAWPGYQNYSKRALKIVQEVTKGPEQHLKKASLASFKVLDSTIRKRLDKNGILRKVSK